MKILVVDLFDSSNILDTTKLAPTEILRIYKEQQSTERGFRFIKDPLFFADSLFVKNKGNINSINDYEYRTLSYSNILTW